VRGAGIRLGVGVALTGALLLLAPGAASAKRFDAYAACNPSSQQPDGVCFQGDIIGAVFRAFHNDSVAYRVCFQEPDGRRRCKARETGQRGVRDRVGFIPFSGRLGAYRVTWKVKGGVVDSDKVILKSEGV
jgi:hypothetical protein